MTDTNEIDRIDFYAGEHIIQAGDDHLIIFPDGNTDEPGIELSCSVLRRILQVAEEQLWDDD